LDYLLVVREVGLQPFESAGVVLGLEVFLELVQLLVGHLIGQPDSHPHLERLVDMLKEAVFLGRRQGRQTHLFQ
jgi:hypothetical protein